MELPENQSPWVLFPTAYLPPLSYLLILGEFLQRGACRVGVDLSERYQKQSFRNRAEIVDSQGRQSLVVPVVHQREPVTPGGESLAWVQVSRVTIDYATPWPRLHVGALRAAYARSPFFAHYAQDFIDCIEAGHTHLHTLNTALLRLLVLHLLGEDLLAPWEAHWSKYTPGDPVLCDLRRAFHPKHTDLWRELLPFPIALPHYYQLFSERIPFEADPSALDYLLCEGSCRHLL